MRGFIICAVLNLGLCYAYPGSNGVGAYAYQDSAGNRYGGTYDLDAVPAESNFIGSFGDFQDDFFPAYFKNFQKFIEQFPNYGGFPNAIEPIPPIPPIQPIQPLQPKFGMPSFGSNLASNSAFAGAVAGPGGVHQVAAIDPPSSKTQNIDISRAGQPQGNSNFYGVSSSAYASSSNVNGKVTGTRRAETVVNDNGKITKYQVGE